MNDLTVESDICQDCVINYRITQYAIEISVGNYIVANQFPTKSLLWQPACDEETDEH